jgi:two-component system, NtrC family, sensor kinase
MADESSNRQDLGRLRAELEVSNRKLAESHKMASLGRLSAGIVHEINTPIGSILSNNEVIRRSLDKVKGLLAEARAAGEPPQEKAMEMLDTVATLTAVDQIACERISGIVRSLKTFARVSEDDLLTIDVNEMVRHTLQLTATVYRRRIAFETRLAELPPVECYPGLLNQVLLNIVVNAAQAIENEGTVTIRTALESHFVHIAVEDTGRGIRPEDRDRIFTAGFTTKPLGEGTGIGLAISREIIVDTLGGTLDFESEPGRGTTFHVRIPVRQARKHG